MKVYIVTYEPFPNGMASTGRIKNYAKAFLSRGIYCEIIIAKRPEIYGLPPKNTNAKDFNCEYPYFYIGGTPLRGSNVFIRQINDFRDRQFLYKYLNSNLKKGDVVLTYLQEQKICERLINIAHNKGVKIIRDLCEFPYGTKEETTKIAIKREKYLKKIFPKYDGAICISESLYTFAQKHKGRNAKLVKVPIMIDEELWDFTNVPGREVSPSYLFHSGALYQQKDGILDVLEAFGIAVQKMDFPVKYLFTGKVEHSPVSNEINEIIQRYDLKDKVEFLGFVSDEDLKSYIKNATGFVINKLENQQNNYCFATKIGEYLLSANPIITTTIGEAKFFLENYRSAILIEPGNTQLLAAKISELFNKDISEEIGRNGKEVAREFFTYQKQGVVLENFLKEL